MGLTEQASMSVPYMPSELYENENTGDKAVAGFPVPQLWIGWLRADKLEAFRAA